MAVATLTVIGRHCWWRSCSVTHYPRYYGQLERQNREHRAWLDAGGRSGSIEQELEEMRQALNARLPRRSLAWSTAATAWEVRKPIVGRERFRGEVAAMVGRLEADRPELSRIDADRLAIHRALMNHGVLRLAVGGKC